MNNIKEMIRTAKKEDSQGNIFAECTGTLFKPSSLAVWDASDIGRIDCINYHYQFSTRLVIDVTQSVLQDEVDRAHKRATTAIMTHLYKDVRDSLSHVLWSIESKDVDDQLIEEREELQKLISSLI